MHRLLYSEAKVTGQKSILFPLPSEKMDFQNQNSDIKQMEWEW